MKKFIAVILIVCLTTGLFPISVFADSNNDFESTVISNNMKSSSSTNKIDENIEQSNDEANSNNGIAVQKNGWIYYSNMDDDDKLYKIKTDGTQNTKLNNVPSYSIYIENEWIYYLVGDYTGNHIYRMKMDGSSVSKIRDYSGRFQVNNGWIYFKEAIDPNGNNWGIYRQSVDGQREELIYEGNKLSGDRGIVDSFCIHEDYVYFTSYQKNHGIDLNKVKIDGTSFFVIKKNVGKDTDIDTIDICCDGKNVYYSSFNSTIRSISIYGGNERIIDNDRSDSLVLCDGWLYYTNLDDNGKLYRIKTDGSSKERLSDTQALNIVVLDNWVYFSQWLLEGPVYREKINDPAIGVFLNGVKLEMDQPPINTKEGRVLVPIRKIAESMGKIVLYSNETNSAFIDNVDTGLIIPINKNVMYIANENGMSDWIWYMLEVPAQVSNGRTLVPMRAFCESLGADVVWNQEAQRIDITYNDPNSGERMDDMLFDSICLRYYADLYHENPLKGYSANINSFLNNRDTNVDATAMAFSDPLACIKDGVSIIFDGSSNSANVIKQSLSEVLEEVPDGGELVYDYKIVKLLKEITNSGLDIYSEVGGLNPEILSYNNSFRTLNSSLLNFNKSSQTKISTIFDLSIFTVEEVAYLLTNYQSNVGYLNVVEQSLRQTGTADEAIEHAISTLRDQYTDKFIGVALDLRDECAKYGVMGSLSAILGADSVALGKILWEAVFTVTGVVKKGDALRTFYGICAYDDGLNKALSNAFEGTLESSEEVAYLKSLYELVKAEKIAAYKAIKDITNDKESKEYADEVIDEISAMTYRVFD